MIKIIDIFKFASSQFITSELKIRRRKSQI
jgi:hypothetical protein